ncbi:Legume-like lectin family protein [Ostertagia ostertagi]
MHWVWGVLAIVGMTMGQSPVFKRFEYKHSFRAPNLAHVTAPYPFGWYTAQMGALGPVFGANDFWTGMGCHRDFRNKPHPIRLRIEYLRNVLSVFVDDGMQPTPRYEACISSEGFKFCESANTFLKH